MKFCGRSVCQSAVRWNSAQTVDGEDTTRWPAPAASWPQSGLRICWVDIFEWHQGQNNRESGLREQSGLAVCGQILSHLNWVHPFCNLSTKHRWEWSQVPPVRGRGTGSLHYNARHPGALWVNHRSQTGLKNQPFLIGFLWGNVTVFLNNPWKMKFWDILVCITLETALLEAGK